MRIMMMVAAGTSARVISEKGQIPPDLVVKSQAINIAEVILGYST
jgi:hypothetical protein